MAHYSINNIIQEVSSDKNFLGTKEIQSTPERKLPIFITRKEASESEYDTIIVGAGVAGLYAAYKIAKAKPSEKILIVEQSKRTGGRLDTDLFYIKENVIKEEEGGMRFTFEDMPQLMNLFVELKLDKHIVPFPMHLDENNRRLFRGRTFSAKESRRNKYKVWSDLYGLKNEEKGIDPSSIIPNMVYHKIRGTDENLVSDIVLSILEIWHKNYLKDTNDLVIIKAENLKQMFPVLCKEKKSSKILEILNVIKQFEDTKVTVTAPVIWQFFRLNFKWKGIELYKWTLWSLLADMGYSKECIEMMARVSGFNGCYYSTMNAGEAFQLLMEFPAEPDFKSLRYGFSQLTNALVDELNKKNEEDRLYNVDILLDTRVEKFELGKVNISIPKKSSFENYIDSKIESIQSRWKGYIVDESKSGSNFLNEIKDTNVDNFDVKRSEYLQNEVTKLINNKKYKDSAVLTLNDLKELEEYYKTYIEDCKITTIGFQNLILALPRVALEKLINASDLNQFRIKDNTFKIDENHLWNNLESTTNQPLAKINLYYENAWWNSDLTPNPDVTFGPNFTDLPLGSVYPFYSDNDEVTNAAAKLQQLKVQISKQEDGPTKEQKSELLEFEGDLKVKIKKLYTKPAALTIYCDYQNINFWQGFAKTLTETNAYPQNNEKVKQIEEFKFIENDDKEVVDTSIDNLIDLTKEYIIPASEQMVSAITEYFQQLFQTNKVPVPIATSVRIWEGSQSLKTDAYGNFGYGVHQWGVGAKDNEVINTMIQPFGDLPIYTCGEAYSDFQGWVEGALRSTNLVLERMKIPTNFTNSSYKNNKELLQYLRAEYKNKFIKP